MRQEHELEARIQALLDGALPAEERTALLSEISRDPKLVDLYLEYTTLECAMSRLHQSQELLRPDVVSDAPSGRFPLNRNVQKWGVIAMAAALIISLGLLIFFENFQSEDQIRVAVKTSPGTRVNVSHDITGETVLTSDVLTLGSRAKLKQGTVELLFPNGIRAIVRGPADLTLNQPDQLYLNYGTAWFHVPEAGIGFQVVTPEMQVVDLGTEFGVRSRQGLPHEVHVFTGEAAVQSRQQSLPLETLDAGMARAVDMIGRLKDIVTEPTHFLNELPESITYLRWSFDEESALGDAGGVHPAAGDAAAVLQQIDNPDAFHQIPGKWGSAIQTHQPLAQAKARWAGLEGNAPRTVSHWIKLSPEEIGTQPIVGWGSHDLSPFKPNPAFLTYVRRLQDEAVAGVSFGAYFLDGTTAINDGQWHHFAVVYSGNTLPDGRPEIICYLNGQREGVTPRFRTDIMASEADGALDISTNIKETAAIPMTLFPRKWVQTARVPLAIDELIIVEAALDQSQILDLYHHNMFNHKE
ncbi:MAG: LamG-like jellyroll fold domain-containing protein [Verrucomicrobiota bacterium]